MEWNSRILTDEQLKGYLTASKVTFSSRVEALISQQNSSWPMLAAANSALQNVTTRDFRVSGSYVRAQHNPARMVSTAARVDAASISKRPCFLCPDNLPAEEKGIPFGSDYVILCNPFPVLENHLVISTREHTPQAIANRFGDLLDVTKELGAGYFTLYNGPACGASAPDHHHFQACLQKYVPLFEEMPSWPRSNFVQADGFHSFTLQNYRLNVLIAKGANKGGIEQWFTAQLEKLRQIAGTLDEPMVNLLAEHDGVEWTVYVFPRSRHRPSCYYADGEARLTISPAGIDLAGVLVVPDPEHFKRLSGEAISEIYTEVSLGF